MAASLSALGHQLRRKALFNYVNILQDKCWYSSSVLAKDLTMNKTISQERETFNEVVEYPLVKPRYPPGKWGDMEPSYAWLWQETIVDLMNIGDVKERQDAITSKEMSQLNILPHHDHPNYLDFAKYATKTCLYPWSEIMKTAETFPSDVNSESLINENLMNKIKNIVIDQILIEQEAVERKGWRREISPFFTGKQAKLLMRCIFDTLTTNLSKHAYHLRTCQYDENITVRAVWDRHGIERKRPHRLGPSPTNFKTVTVLNQRLTSSCIFNGMIRSHIPLPQFQPRESGLSTESEKPVLEYKFSTYGVTKMTSQKSKSILAGHVLGDPCEYGTVGFLLTNDRKELDEKFGSKIAKECRLGRGLTSTFTWLAAQAYNQGFSGFIDLTYPLTSQTVLSDGQNFSFLACQLNTLELWKSDSANDMVNLCWYSDEMPLYECVENGQVKGFNDDVLKMLIKVFLLQPADRGYDMKPTISEKETNLHEKSDFIPGRVEEVVEEEEERYIV